MPWVRFDRDFDWRFGRSAMKAFRGGSIVMVTTDCAKKAKAAGTGCVVSKPAQLKSTKDGQTVSTDD